MFSTIFSLCLKGKVRYQRTNTFGRHFHLFAFKTIYSKNYNQRYNKTYIINLEINTDIYATLDYLINFLFYFLQKNVLCQKSACHLILIKSDNILPKTDRADDFIISVGQEKDLIEEIITSCIEEPLDHMLQKWSEDLKLEHFRGNASDVIAEIEAIRTKLVSRNGIDTKEVDSNIPSTSSETVVPSNVKDYLFG